MSQDRLDFNFQICEQVDPEVVIELQNIIKYLDDGRRDASSMDDRVWRLEKLSVMTRIGLDAAVRVQAQVDGCYCFQPTKTDMNTCSKSMSDIQDVMDVMKECGGDPHRQIFIDSSFANGKVNRHGCPSLCP